MSKFPEPAWLEDHRAEHKRWLEAHGIQPKKYHRLVWAADGSLLEWQETADGPTYVWGPDLQPMIKPEKRSRKKEQNN